MLRVNSCEVRNRELQEETKHKPQPQSEGRAQAASPALVTVLQGSMASKTRGNAPVSWEWMGNHPRPAATFPSGDVW